MLGTHPGVVEAGGDGMAFPDLTFLVLERHAVRPVKYSGTSSGERGTVAAGLQAFSRRLHPEEPHLGVCQKRGEDAHRVGASADRGDHQVGKGTLRLQHLTPGLVPDDALEVPHHERERVGACDGAEQIVGVLVAR